MKAVVLLSGGLDSVTALYHVQQSLEVVGALSFDYNSKHNHKEIPFAVWHCQKLGIPYQIINLDFISRLFKSDLLISGGDIPEGHYEDESMKSTVVPFRNGIMLAIAAGYAESIEASGLVIAAHAGDHAIYPDCREDFMSPMEEAIHHGTYNQVQVFRPFIEMTKTQIVSCGDELGVDFKMTWSCYKGGEIHCGLCGTCVERREAFKDAGVADPTPYEVDL